MAKLTCTNDSPPRKCKPPNLSLCLDLICLDYTQRLPYSHSLPTRAAPILPNSPFLYLANHRRRKLLPNQHDLHPIHKSRERSTASRLFTTRQPPPTNSNPPHIHNHDLNNTLPNPPATHNPTSRRTHLGPETTLPHPPFLYPCRRSSSTRYIRGTHLPSPARNTRSLIRSYSLQRHKRTRCRSALRIMGESHHCPCSSRSRKR